MAMTSRVDSPDFRSLPATPARKTVGVIRVAAGLLVLVAMVTQVSDRVVNNVFVPSEYFAYFTIQSSMMNIVVLLVGGYLALRYKRDTVVYTGVRAATLVFAVVTAGVYNVLLRGVPAEGFVGVQWPNEVEHVWIPILIVIDWLFSTGRARLGFRWIWVAVGFPVIWCAFTLIRGAATDFYPYPFINPATAGWGSVFVYIIALSALIVGLSALAIKYSRVAWRQKDE